MYSIKLNVKELTEKANNELIDFERNQNYDVYYYNDILTTCVDSLEELNNYPNLKQLLIK